MDKEFSLRFLIVNGKTVLLKERAWVTLDVVLDLILFGMKATENSWCQSRKFLLPFKLGAQPVRPFHDQVKGAFALDMKKLLLIKSRMHLNTWDVVHDQVKGAFALDMKKLLLIKSRMHLNTWNVVHDQVKGAFALDMKNSPMIKSRMHLYWTWKLTN